MAPPIRPPGESTVLFSCTPTHLALSPPLCHTHATRAGATLVHLERCSRAPSLEPSLTLSRLRPIQALGPCTLLHSDAHPMPCSSSSIPTSPLYKSCSQARHCLCHIFLYVFLTFPLLFAPGEDKMKTRRSSSPILAVGFTR